MKIRITGFIEGILSLLVSQILIKIFGVLYSLYLTNKNGFGDTGNAIYMSGYQIYALLLTISSIGVPNSISKLISEKDSIKDYKNANRIFYVAIFIFSIIGFIGFLILFIFSDIIANNILLIPEAKLSLRILSPAILFVSVMSVIRGYCNGENKIIITAKSQFFEQLLKSILTIFFVEIVSYNSNNNIELMVASASAATTIATFFSLMYIILKYKKTYKRISGSKSNKKLENNKRKKMETFPREKIYIIFKQIVKISLPITISAILSSFCKNIDAITVVRILKKYMSESDALKKYGIISSKVDILIAFPLSFNTIISTALIPEISRRKAQNDIIGIVNKIKVSLYLSLCIGLPATFGMFFYSEEIFLLLFPNAYLGAELLQLASISLLFSCLSQTITGILQGLGKNNIPLFATFIGIIGKLLCNIVLINIVGIYEKGAIIGNIFLSISMFFIEFVNLKKYINIDVNIIKDCSIPITICIAMIIISKKVYFLLLGLLSQSLSIIGAILVCIFVYIGLNYYFSRFNDMNLNKILQ